MSQHILSHHARIHSAFVERKQMLTQQMEHRQETDEAMEDTTPHDDGGLCCE